MRVIVVGRDNTEYAHEMLDWMRDFEKQTKQQPELIDPDSHEGESLCKAYDVVEYPSVLVLDSDVGRMSGLWRGTPMPQIDEVAYYSQM